jgi:ABC-type multidrug transport system fused ATPase/permease subunit
VAARKLSRRIRELSRERRRRSGLVSAVAEEALSNVALVQAYCCEDAETQRLHREGQGALNAQMAAARLRALFSPLLDLLEAAGGLAVLGAGAWELSHGRLTLGGLLVFLTYLGKLYRPVRGLSSYNNTVYTAAASAERILHLLDQKPATPATPGTRRLVRPRGIVEFEHVHFTYPGTDTPALEDVSFRIEPGETLAIIGRSGAGKSTVLKLLLRFYDPDRGRILLDGQDLRELEACSVREAIAVLLQESYVFHGTVAENIAYGRPGADAAAVEAAARLAAADEFICALPAGYATETGQKGRRLSGGQRQRIAIARAMIRDAAVLVLDEPTTGLDADAEQKILAPLRRLMSGRATILVSHNLRATRLATRLVLLEKGRLVAQGIHADLLARSEGYAALWRQQESDSLLAAGGLAP